MSAITSIEPTKAKPAAGVQAKIPPRRIDFDFSADRVPRYYVDGNPFKTTFVTALSSLFPEGEFFFVEAVRHYRNQITDPVLKAQISGFIGQEALHSLAHKAFNDAATVQGFQVDKLDRDVGFLLRQVKRFTPPIVHLAATACLEHYTAVFTEMLLKDEEVINTFSPEIRNLYLWHSVEENEHKTVAFDVYEAVGGGYLLRASFMIPTTIVFFAVIFWFQARLLAKDGQLFKVRQNLKGFNYIFGRKGVLSSLIPQYLDWFKPNFHPSHHDTDALLATWQEKLFGEDGLLTAKIRTPSKKLPH
ncbi:metal-dependent hydrolase [Aquirhabdus sp.]|uniref:metal-dependent hydrolase n=1 Tax=Aquirhabdus sp. TaxID=2824160 RepID=UPI00396C59F0